MTTYYVQFIRQHNDSSGISVGGFTGEQVDELCGIIFDDPRTRTSFYLQQTQIDEIVRWYRLTNVGNQAEALRYNLMDLGRVYLDVKTIPDRQDATVRRTKHVFPLV